MPIGNLALLLMVAGYLSGACLSLLAPSPRAARLATVAGAIAGCLGGLGAAASVLVTGSPVASELPGLAGAVGGVVLHLDLLGAFFLALVAAISAPAAVYGATYMAEYEGRCSLRVFGFLFNAFLLGMSLVPCAASIFTFLLVWELMAVTSYFLVMTDSGDRDTRQAGLWYIAMTHAGLVLLLPMFFVLAPSADATTFADLRAGASILPATTRNGVFLLALLGFGPKAGIVPLHVWLPRAHPAAPSHVSALMSGVMIKLGIYGLVVSLTKCYSLGDPHRRVTRVALAF